MMKAFTLVEILIVVVILGILAAVVVPQFASASNECYMIAAKGFEKALQSGVAMYLRNQKKMPATFWSWVAYGGSISELNSVQINSSLRGQLVDPHAEVVSNGYKTITLHFRNGLTGVYTINDAGMITATYQK